MGRTYTLDDGRVAQWFSGAPGVSKVWVVLADGQAALLCVSPSTTHRRDKCEALHLRVHATP